jgi:hypothetical protein
VGWDTLGALESISTYRRLVKELKAKDLDCELDESAFCKKCAKDSSNRVFTLVVRLPDQKAPHRTTLRSTDDLTVLLKFLTNQNKHAAGPAGEQPLKDHLPRIRELLGIKEPAAHIVGGQVDSVDPLLYKGNHSFVQQGEKRRFSTEGREE